MRFTDLANKSIAGIACALWACCGVAAAQTDYVVRVGDEQISVAEFQQRAQNMMKTGFRHIDIEDPQAKKVFLDGIIAHELLAQEGMRRGLDRDTVVADEVRRVEEQALRSKLYEVAALTGDYSSTEEELQMFFVEREFDTEVYSQHIVCATEAEAWEVLNRLGEGETFAELFLLYSVPHIQKRFAPAGRVGWVKTGGLLPPLIEPFKSMKPGEVYPQPVETSSGFHVFKLEERRQTGFAANRDWLERRLREVKRGRDMEAYVNELRQRYALTLNPEAMQRLQALAPGVKEWSGEDQVLLNWQGGELTLSEYLEYHRLGRVKHPASLDSARLHKAADGLAGREIMLAEARRLKLDDDPEIRTKTKTRRDELLIQWLYRVEGKAVALEQDVKEEEIRTFYDENTDMFTREDGEVAGFDLVRDSIRGALLTHKENKAMDDLIARLREERKGEIEIYLIGLDRVQLVRPVAPGKPEPLLK